jgi:predicted aspartyl protease
MAVRVRAKLRQGSIELETTALVNTGFEAPAPDLALPVEAARRLGLWPPRRAKLVVADTGGGVEVEGRRRTANVLVNPHIDEVLISDYLAGELGIVILDPRRGLCSPERIWPGSLLSPSGGVRPRRAARRSWNSAGGGGAKL